MEDPAKLTAEQKLYWLNALQVEGDWSVHDDGEGRLFYYDRKANASRWEVPEPLAPLETEFMMKLMLQNAVARSSVWTAHDAGNGTLYYFNAKTRESKWERPSEWGQAEVEAAVAPPTAPDAGKPNDAESGDKAVDYLGKKEKKVKKEKKKKHKKHKAVVKEKEEQEEEVPVAPQHEEEEPLTPDELKAEEERKAREQKRIEQFRAMLRNKNIMPFCKWSVALPQIAADPRFMGVPTMDERRAIFEHFIEHRREDLKAEKKSKHKQAKQLFAQYLREQFQHDSWDSSTTLSVFMSTLEDRVEPERYKHIQDNALALLTTSAQEKIYAKAVEELKVEALKRDGEQLRLTKFLEEQLAKQDKSELIWKSGEAQQLIHEFYASAASSGEPTVLLSELKQQQVFEEVTSRMVRDRGLKREEGGPRQLERSRSRRRSPSRERTESKRRNSSPQQEARHSRHDRRRSRSHSRRRRSHSRSRSESRGGRDHRDRRSRRRRSASSSRSRSRSRGRSSRRSSRHHRSDSSLRSRSRTH